MSLFEENSKFAPLVENDNRVKMEDIETVFKSYGENVALLIKKYHNYFEWEASSTIAPEPAYVNNTNIVMKYFWNYIDERLKQHSAKIDAKPLLHNNVVDFIYKVQSELDAIRQYGDLIDVYHGIANDWVNYDDNFIKNFSTKVDLFDRKFCKFIIQEDIIDKLTDIVREKQEYNETLDGIKERVMTETKEEKDYSNNLYHDEEYQLINNMIKSVQNYMSSFIHNLYVDEKLNCLPRNSAFEELYPDRLFYSTQLTKDELLQYIVKPIYGIEDAHKFLKKIYDYMWEYKPDADKMRMLTYSVLDVAEYDYHKNIMTLESISATSDRKATTLLACRNFIKTIEKILDYAKFEFGHEYERDEEFYNYIDNIANQFKHNFDIAYDRRMLLVFPNLVEKYEEAKEELHLAYNPKGKSDEKHHKTYDKLMKEIKDFIEKESQEEAERAFLSSFSR